MKCFHAVIPCLLSATILVATASLAVAQTPDEHAKHHPKPQPAPDSAAAMAPGMGTPDSSGAKPGGMGADKPGGMGDMMSGMGDMMKEMGKPPEKAIYPSLMQLPDVSPEKRDKLKQMADGLVAEGNALLNLGLGQLSGATRNSDMAAMQEATEQIRRGQILLETGLAARQALAENKDPRLTAMQWFKSEMNLAPASQTVQPHGFFGLSWFHYLTMLLFAVFAALMVWMYFHKMKRADALVAKLTGSTTETVPPPAGATPAPPPSDAVKPGATAENTATAAVNPDIAPSKSNAWTGTMLVAEIFDETPQVKTFRLTDPAGGKLPFNYLPGQFLTITVVPNGVPVKRSYTIASSPTRRDYCEITVKHEAQGEVSHHLDTLFHEGELLQLTGPSGKFTFVESDADSVVLIAGGVGVTPMMSVIRYLTDRSWKGDIFFFFGCKSGKDIIYREEIEYLQKRYPNLHVCILLAEADGSKSDYLTGNITKEILAERVPEIASRHVHICGPVPMIEAVKGMLDELKVPKENVRIELFAGAPAPPASPLAPEEAGKTGVVTFSKSNKTAVLTPDKSVLEASEEVGVNIEYSCRVGTCGVCKVKLISGKVTMAVEDSLTDEDKAQNIILACQAKATEDVSVEA